MEEWFETSPEATIHSGIRRLAKKLKNGDSVVLDDCNPTEKARSALVSALRKQSIEFTLEGVEFRPKGGILQCSVSAEFLLAAKAEEIERQRLDLKAHIDISDDDEVDSDPDSGSDGEEGNSDKKCVAEVWRKFWVLARITQKWNAVDKNCSRFVLNERCLSKGMY